MTSDRLAVIVPMKPFDLAKQRLRPAVNDGERVALARAMLVHVLTTVAAGGIGDLRVLVSADPDVLALAGDHGFAALCEGTPGYNEAVTQAIGWAQAHGTTSALILPADLPQLAPADLQALVRLAGDSPQAVVLAPDAAGTGTNALLLRPPDLLPPSFGPDSYQRHLALARGAGVEASIYRDEHVAGDVDWPSDLWLATDITSWVVASLPSSAFAPGCDAAAG